MINYSIYNILKKYSAGAIVLTGGIGCCLAGCAESGIFLVSIGGAMVLLSDRKKAGLEGKLQ